ncbi:ATP-binding protein [Bacillus sp. NP157]|nr:ATP-binding protein [Bacillus sp. NP157]
MEALLPLMLAEENWARFSHPVFSESLKTIGLSAVLSARVETSTHLNRKLIRDQYTLRYMQRLASGTRSQADEGVKGPRVSKERAAYILSTTHYDDFENLDEFVRAGGRHSVLSLGGEDPLVNSGKVAISPGAIRLGLMNDYLRILDIEVRPLHNANKFETSKSISIFELSSGEFHYFTVAMGALFAVADDAVLLIDEPEGSLHPQWQLQLMDLLSSLVQDHRDCHLIAATHSPLIVSNAPEDAAVVDMDAPEASEPGEAAYGKSSDQILFEQFGIASSRNKAIVDVVQKAVGLVERNEHQSSEFEALQKELSSIRIRLDEGDPLVEVIDALISLGEV